MEMFKLHKVDLLFCNFGPNINLTQNIFTFIFPAIGNYNYVETRRQRLAARHVQSFRCLRSTGNQEGIVPTRKDRQKDLNPTNYEFLPLRPREYHTKEQYIFFFLFFSCKKL